jgi:anhydro-N-acetylmuramic acid kinase
VIATSKTKSMIVAGVMSGTSADGVDVAVCRIGPGLREGDPPRVKLIGHLEATYPKAVRAAVLRVMEGEAVPAAQMSRLNWRLGAIYADCVEKAAAKFGVKVGLVGCHGQTVHHEATATRYLGATVRSTWQIGEAAVIAERLWCPVVSDFRPADLAAGGQGAPLVPMLDWCMFRSAKVSRVLQNLGGIGNLAALPAGCGVNEVMAFDTGPGNMVIDACMAALYGKKFDRNGAMARRGRVLREVVTRVMREGYFSAPPPKSCGREEFGATFTARLIGLCRDPGGADADVVATATALTAESILAAYRDFVWAHVGAAAPIAQVEFCVAGGGAKNRTLMGMLREGFAELGVRVRLMEELGVPAQAKEGVAFALLAWLTWNGLAGNIPAATGACRPAILGKVSYG